MRPYIKGTDLMRETEFYKWLFSQDSEGNKQNRFVDSIKEYFGESAPFKERGAKDLEHHKYVFEAYQYDKHHKH